jgi:hypothetical protein
MILRHGNLSPLYLLQTFVSNDRFNVKRIFPPDLSVPFRLDCEEEKRCKKAINGNGSTRNNWGFILDKN